jgi:ABC-2 type transport system ATP-binding protein
VRTLQTDAGDVAVASPPIEARDVRRRFRNVLALDGVSIDVRAGEVHALLGPNGAGKTTLLRILLGLADPDGGEVRVLGATTGELTGRRVRTEVGLVPSGDRTFYMRISGLENLRFFARLHGLSKRDATKRAEECLRLVGLDAAAGMPVAQYSHGMQKRLSVARAILVEPPVLFVDEATHDLDPVGARTVQDLVSAAADRGSAVVWATQRLDEIRGFAHRVTVLHRGRVRFVGTVPELMSLTTPRRFLVHVAAGGLRAEEALERARAALAGIGSAAPSEGSSRELIVVTLSEGHIVGQAVVALTGAGLDVLSCREERSEIESAFLFLTGGEER